jgi:hypothetical protein
MVGLRRIVFALLGALATVLATVLVPAAAQAQPPQGGGNAITIISAGPDSTGDPYDLTVYADDANGDVIGTMTAHVYDDTDTDVANVPMTAVDTSNTSDQQFAATAPIAQASLPAGTYTVTVDADDGSATDSDDTNIPAPEPFSFSYTTTVSVTPSQTTVSQDSDSVSFSGLVTGQAPGGTAVPLSGVPVSLSIDSATPNSIGTTGSDGSFSYSASGIQASSDYNFSVASSSTYTQNNDDVQITAVASSTVMTASASPGNISEGSTNVTFSGNVQTAAGTPIVGATVSMSVNGGALTPLANPTDSNGNFSTVVDGAQPTTYTFSITGTSLYSGASANANVGTTAAPTTMTMNTPSPATVSQGSQQVTFSGTVTTTAGNSPVVGALVSVTTPGGTTSQVATTGSGGAFSWTDSSAQPGQYSFDIPNDPNGLYNGTSATASVTATQAPTSINFPYTSSTEPTVTEGSTSVLLTGTVTAQPAGISAPAPVAGAAVSVTFDGTTVSVGTTSSTGAFSYLASNISGTTSYTFSVPAGGLYTSGSGAVTVTALQAPTSVAVTPSSATVTQGSDSVPFVVTATATPPGISLPVAVANAPVLLSIGGAAATQVGTTNSAGTFDDTIAGITASATYEFSIGSTPLSASSSDPSPVQVTAHAATTSMTVTASPAAVHGPQTVTFTGSVLTAGTSPIAISGAPVSLSVSGGSAQQVTTTQSDGSFTYQLTGAVADADYNFSVPGTALYTQATSDIELKINEATTSIAVKPSSMSVTEGAESITFTGSVTGVLEFSGNTTVPEAPVEVGEGSNPDVETVTTDTNGDFTATLTGIAKTTDVNFAVAAGSDYTKASTQVQIVAIPAETRVVGTSTTPVHLKYGQKVTIRGVAQYAGANGWVALPGSRVQVKVGAYGPAVVKTATNGSFSVTSPTLRGPNWSASIEAGDLIETASAGGILTIQVPLRVNAFAAGLTVGGTVAASGCLQTTVSYSRGPDSQIHIDYSAGARGPWKELGSIPLRNSAHNPPGCNAVSESYFNGSIRAKLDNAYYRADFPANFGFDGTLSRVVHSARTQTKITNFSVNPTEVNYKGVVTITGRLWRHGKSWQPYANRQVQLVYYFPSSTKMYPISAVTTSRKGYFSGQARIIQHLKFVAIVYAVYQGSSTDLAARSNGIDLSVNHGKDSPPLTAPSPVPALLQPVIPGMALLGAEVIAIREDVRQIVSPRSHHHRRQHHRRR